MLNKDNELDAIGAEALPGGLQDMREPDRGPVRSPTADASPRPSTPLVGLIDLVRSWMLGSGRRR